jgi:small subunit ribosomal protein S16
MSVRVRLTRVGSNKNPIWRVVVADQRSPRDGRFVETIGHYNPQTNPSTIRIDEERFQHWVSRGAQPTNTVKQLVKAQAKGVAGGTSTGGAGVSQAPVAEPEAAGEGAEEAPSDVVEERAEATGGEAPAADAPADERAAPDAPAGGETTE